MIAPVSPVLMDGIDDGPVSCLADEDGFDEEEDPPPVAEDLDDRLLQWTRR